MVQKSKKYTENSNESLPFHPCSPFAQFPAKNHCSLCMLLKFLHIHMNKNIYLFPPTQNMVY